MGGYHWSKKDRVDDCDDIDVFWLNQHGYFCGRKCGGIKWTNNWGREASVSFCVDVMGNSKYIEFNYTCTSRSTGEKTDYRYKVPLVTTRCNYGGVRYWFQCPLQQNGIWCGKRVGKLFLGGKYFGCRHCYNLTYDSRNETRSGKYGYLGRMFKCEGQIEKLYKKMKIKYRKGKPTKLYRKIMRLEGSSANNALHYIDLNDLLSKK